MIILLILKMSVYYYFWLLKLSFKDSRISYIVTTTFKSLAPSATTPSLKLCVSSLFYYHIQIKSSSHLNNHCSFYSWTTINWKLNCFWVLNHLPSIELPIEIVGAVSIANVYTKDLTLVVYIIFPRSTIVAYSSTFTNPQWTLLFLWLSVYLLSSIVIVKLSEQELSPVTDTGIHIKIFVKGSCWKKLTYYF
jgi:hypothetical protein